MSIFRIGLLVFIFVMSALSRATTEQAYEVLAPSASAARAAHISLHHALIRSSDDQLSFEAYLSLHDVARLQAKGFLLKLSSVAWVKQYDSAAVAALSHPSHTGIVDFVCYETVEEIYRRAERLVSLYPGLVEWIDIGDSWQKTVNLDGYDLRVLKIGNQTVSGDKPDLFINASMHAREYTPAALALRFAERLLDGYGVRADETWIVDSQETHILLLMNPDGRKKAEAGLLWRKNTNQNYCGASSQWRGADLNRNFSFNWNSAGPEASSGYGCDETYRGPVAASEPETQAVQHYWDTIFGDYRGDAMMDAAPANTPGIMIDLHSYSRLVLWPWGDREDDAPNAVSLQTLGRRFAFFNRYTPEQAIGLYATDGSTDDHVYGKLGVASYTFELGTAFFQQCSAFYGNSYNVFVPDPASILGNVDALMYAAKVARAPYQLPAGPSVFNAQVHKQGDDWLITAQVRDDEFNQSNGVESSQPIQAVEMYLNLPPWHPDARAVVAFASDGLFDESVEEFALTVASGDLGLGQTLLYLRAQDANGDWGPVTALHVGDAPLNRAPLARFTLACNGNICAFDGRASRDPEEGLVTFAWLFDDGSTATTAALEKAMVTGAHSVRLTVSDSAGNTHSSEQAFQVETATSAATSENHRGGSFAFVFIVLAGLCCFYRRQRTALCKDNECLLI